MKKVTLFLTGILFVVLQACGGGGSSTPAAGSVSGLEVASEMSLVESQSVTAGSANIAKAFSATKAAPTSGAYLTDPLNTYVYDESMEALEIINEILCSMDQTQYATANLVNADPYIALIDNEACSKSSDKSSEQGNQSSGSAAEELETWVVKSERSSSSASHIVRVWIKEDSEGEFEPAKEIQAKAKIVEGVSATSPNGRFHLDFKMVNASDTSKTIATGYLETVDRDDDLIEFQFAMEGTDDFDVSEGSHVVTNVAGTEGHAYASHSFSMGSFTETGAYQVAYNGNYYKTVKGSTEKCLDRKNYNSKVFRYGVYSASGSRLNIANPGFGITIDTDDDGTIDEFGWAGYWGIWFPDSITITNGMEVKRDVSGTETTYTVVYAPGKLIKHTRSTLTLADLASDNLDYWDENGQGVRVQWTNGNLYEVATQSFGQSGPTWTTLDTPVLFSYFADSWYGFWREGIGNVQLVVPSSGIISNTTEVSIDTQAIQVASDLSGELTLNCYQDCPHANITQAQIDWTDSATPFETDSNNVNTPTVYTISPTDMTLKLSGESVALVTGVIPGSTSPNSWGVHSGGMVTDAVKATMTNPWDVWSQDVFYSWETGHQQWNKFTGLKDSNSTAVDFDPPVQLRYTHTASSDTYFLDYSGFGELHGIPWEQDEDMNNRWYPTLTIPDGSEATNSGTTYYIRALDMEQTMQTVAASNCSGLTINTSIGAPQAVSVKYTDPSLGTKPTVTDDPKVIKGIVQ